MKLLPLFGRLATGLALVCAVATQAQAGVVSVFGERFNTNIIHSFYNNLPGHSSTLNVPGVQLNAVSLTGVNLLWAVQPDDAYTADELTAMANFLAGGGRIAFMGEHGTFAPLENGRINTALSILGSTISIIPGAVVDASFRIASVADGQILAHPLTVGVNRYEYAAFDPLTISGTAQVLMVGEENFPNNIMMAFQNIGPGSIFLITDQNVWDNSLDWGSSDNARMFENLLSGNTGAPPVCGQPGQPPCDIPEPGSLVLLAIGLAGLQVARRKQRS